MAAAANRRQQIVRAGEVHGGDYVRHIDTPDDEPGTLVDHSVVNQTRGLVRLVTWLDDGAAHAGTKLFELNRCHGHVPWSTSSSASAADCRPGSHRRCRTALPD